LTSPASTQAKLTSADKVGDTRTTPLTAYLAWLLASPPSGKGAGGAPNPSVFASASKSGRIADPGSSQERALQGAGIDALNPAGPAPILFAAGRVCRRPGRRRPGSSGFRNGPKVSMTRVSTALLISSSSE
jgi:hypothetical protein